METIEHRIRDQRVTELEFRVQTLEKAVLASAERIAVLERMWERFYTTGSKRLLDDIFREEETKQ
jgi:hypothetical protein